MRRTPRILAPLALAAAGACAALVPAPAAAQIQAVSLVQNLPYPLHVTAPPGDTERLFIVSQLGDVRILKNGSLLPAPFLDLTGEVLSASFEQGMLCLEFDPGYASNGWFYVHFIQDDGTMPGRSVVRRYTVSANPDSADENSAHPILELPQIAVNHNGGNLVFGPDGYLWIGFGDGGSSNTARDPLVWFGKMLRIDVHGDDFPADSTRNYAVPPTNPFVGDPGTLDEIWALGLRNPWRYEFDRLTGDLYIGDVGAARAEEIDFVASAATDSGGMNFGWPSMEADSCNSPPVNCDDGSFTYPIYSYPHTMTSAHAIVGGRVYRGSALPAALYGHYFFSDESWPGLWSFRFENGQVTELTDWSSQLDVGGALKFPAHWHEDEAGELYVVEYRTGALGEVWKIVPDPAYVGVEPRPEPARGVLLGVPRPNPFREETRFPVTAPRGDRLDVAVHDVAGRLVRRLHAGPGTGAVRMLAWDGRDAAGSPVSAGIYFVRATAGESVRSRRVLLTR
jgi:glucose/arabinose dehydrogenase